MAVCRDGRGHQSPGRQALCEGRDHILCVWWAPRPRAGSVFTGPGRALRGTSAPVPGCLKPPGGHSQCVGPRAWGAGAPFGDVSWRFRRVASHHPVSFLQAGPPRSGDGRRLRGSWVGTWPRGARVGRVQEHTVRCPRGGPAPSASFYTRWLCHPGASACSQPQVYVSLSAQGRWREASAVTSWCLRDPRWELGLSQAGPSWSGLLRWQRPVAGRPWFRPLRLSSGGAGAVARCSGSLPCHGGVRPPRGTEQKVGLRSHREDCPPGTVGGTVARALGAAGSSGRCALGTHCLSLVANVCP